MSSFPNVPNIQQVQADICWAACIEMVARFISPDQCEALMQDPANRPLQKAIVRCFYHVSSSPITSSQLRLIESAFCVPDTHFSSISSVNNYGLILRKQFEISCDCQAQYGIPNFNFLQDTLSSGNPVILGVIYPGINRKIRHAVIVKQTAEVQLPDREIKLLKVNDPYASESSENSCRRYETYNILPSGITAYVIYQELNRINPQNAPSINKIFLVYNFSGQLPAIMHSNLPDRQPVEYQTYTNIAEITTTVKYMFEHGVIFKEEYAALVKSYNTTKIKCFLSTPVDFCNRVNSQEIYINPIISNGDQKFDTIISLDTVSHNGSLHLLAIRESYFPKLRSISNVSLPLANGTVQEYGLNHEEPNYVLLHLQPIDLRFLVIHSASPSDAWYVSLSNFPSLGLGFLSANKFYELRNLLINKLNLVLNNNEF